MNTTRENDWLNPTQKQSLYYVDALLKDTGTVDRDFNVPAVINFKDFVSIDFTHVNDKDAMNVLHDKIYNKTKAIGYAITINNLIKCS